MKLSKLLIGLLLVFVSCDDDNIIPLNANIIFETKAYDLDNNGNASDIRVDFITSDNSNVAEFRVMLIPNNSSIDVSTAQSLSPDRYLSITPSTSSTYSVNRLPASLLDVNGNAVANGITYISGVLVVGTGDVQLSTGAFSRDVLLEDRGIYSGRYITSSEGECTFIDGNTGSFRSAFDEKNFVDLTASMNDYDGEVRCPDCPGTRYFLQGRVDFTVVGTTISNYVWDWPTHLCGSSLCNIGVDLCAILEQGEGIIVDEVTLEIAVTNTDCTHTCTGTRFWTREG